MRYLFAPMPATGHVNPGLPLAKALVQRGHDVRWYSIPRFKKAIESVGARFVPFRNASTLDEEQLESMFPDRPRGGLAQLRYDIKNIFVAAMPGMLRDCEEELRREPADVIIGDNAYDAVPGFVGAPIGTFAEHRKTTSPASAKNRSINNDETLLAALLIKKL